MYLTATILTTVTDFPVLILMPVQTVNAQIVLTARQNGRYYLTIDASNLNGDC